ncbi:MAG: ABC transporter permease [Pirellulaceae bacterium]
MNIWTIAWRSVRHRGIASGLTMASMALGVSLVVLVLTVYGVVNESFRANSTLGYHLVVGARGGSLQLTLNSVFFLSRPVENIPYEYYLAFRTAEERRPELLNSIAYRSYRAAEDSREILAATQCGFGGGIHELMLDAVLDQTQQAELEPMGLDDPGMFSNFTGFVIPLCLGDSYKSYRVIGTTPEYFTVMYDLEREKTYSFENGGRNFQTHSEENGYFECVIGSTVAHNTGLRVGDKINPTHGAPDDPNAHEHEQEFTVVGILEPSGTPSDRGVFVNMEGFYLINDHAKPVDEELPGTSSNGSDDESSDSGEGEEGSPDEWKDLLGARGTARADSSWTPVSYRPNALPSQAEGESAEHDHDHDHGHAEFEPLPVEQREITSMLVLAEDGFGGDFAAMHMSNMVNSGMLEGTLKWSGYRPIQAQRSAQACQPVMEIDRLFQTIVSPVQALLLGLTVLICVVSGISILVSIYNSMSERRTEIAVMRALGARRTTILSIVLLESFMLTALGGGIGWLIAHTCNAIASPTIEGQIGIGLSFFQFVPAELALLPGLMILSISVGLIPAISAYRTDVSQHLGK